MTELKTHEGLLRALELASAHIPTSDELRKQRVSFIMGTLKENSSVTRAQVEAILSNQEGKAKVA